MLETLPEFSVGGGWRAGGNGVTSKSCIQTKEDNTTGNHTSQNNAPTLPIEAGCAPFQGEKQAGHETFFPANQELLLAI
jgi:hypothetical protein